MTDRNLIDYAMDDDGVKFREALYASIHDKVSAHIEAKKQEIASTLVAMPSESQFALQDVGQETPVENA
jgi:hypothetical protein